MSESSDDEAAGATEPEEGAEDVERLREQVEEQYDFEDFGPSDMAAMEPEEWEAAFDADTWITGEALLERVEAELRTRVAVREVFARIERFGDVLVAYDENGYAAVYPDGSVEGRGTVLRDVKPTVALCSMDTYEVAEPPAADQQLPEPEAVTESSDALGNTVLQVIGAVQLLAGLVLLGAAVLSVTGLYRAPGVAGAGTNLAIVVIAAIGFLGVGVFLFVTVANARLSDRFRAEEYRDRLRAIGLADGERPAFLAEIEGVDIEQVGPGSGTASGASTTLPEDGSVDESPTGQVETDRTGESADGATDSTGELADGATDRAGETGDGDS